MIEAVGVARIPGQEFIDYGQDRPPFAPPIGPASAILLLFCGRRIQIPSACAEWNVSAPARNPTPGSATIATGLAKLG